MLDMKKLRRFFLLPFGFLKMIFELSNERTRDIENRFRFKNAIIDKGCCISLKSIIHPNVHMLENSIVNDSKINSYTYIGKNCLIQNTSIGKFCSIANDVLIGLGKHPIDHFSTSTLFYRKNNTLKIELINRNLEFEEYKTINIGNDVWIGARAIIMDGVKIGDGAIIATNAVVVKDVPPYAIVGGVPAKIIKYRFSMEKIEELQEQKWWEWDLEEIKNYYKL